jgi:hypothetical protein
MKPSNPINPSFSVKASILAFPHAARNVRLDFWEEGIRVYGPDGQKLLYLSEYSDVRRCHYDDPHVLPGSGMGITLLGAPAMLSPALLEIFILKSCEGRSGRVEKYVVSQATPELPADRVEKMFWWIRDTIQSAGGSLKWTTPRDFTVVT